ncbi:MAG: AraC family transcriptional regulator ligand-binding domain-containing protein [Pseudomonadota bacterium]
MNAGNRTFSDSPLRPGVHPAIAASTVAFALSRGVTMDQITVATGLRGNDLAAGTSRPPEEILPQLWRLLAAEVPSKTPLTMEMARGVPFSLFADLAHGMQFAETVGEAITLLVEHQRVLSDRIQSELVVIGEEASLLSEHPLNKMDAGRTCEMTKAFAWRLLTHLAVEDISPLRVEFAHAPTGSLDGYAALFGVTPHFNASRTAIVVPAAVLDVPIQHASAELFSFVKQHLAAQEERQRAANAVDALASLKAAVTLASQRGEFAPEAVARGANMGYRQAQRLAARNGTTLGALIEANRFSLARELLARRENTIESVALVLGFADDRAFRRAFRRVTGSSPSEFRRTVQEGIRNLSNGKDAQRRL